MDTQCQPQAQSNNKGTLAVLSVCWLCWLCWLCVINDVAPPGAKWVSGGTTKLRLRSRDKLVNCRNDFTYKYIYLAGVYWRHIFQRPQCPDFMLHHRVACNNCAYAASKKILFLLAFCWCCCCDVAVAAVLLLLLLCRRNTL